MVRNALGELEAELEAGRRFFTPAGHGGHLRQGIESGVAFYCAEAAAVEGEKILGLSFGREEMAHPRFQSPHGTAQIQQAHVGIITRDITRAEASGGGGPATSMALARNHHPPRPDIAAGAQFG